MFWSRAPRDARPADAPRGIITIDCRTSSRARRTDGVFCTIQPGTILIDTSSIATAAARARGQGADAGATMLDAPVSGGEVGADRRDALRSWWAVIWPFAAVKTLLDAMGNPDRVIRIGRIGRRSDLVRSATRW
jgi:3-hydroxyisobutyrate dehydrogenase-like beta-hydroxyacid dehydrogenase